MIALFNIKNYRNIAINPEISFSDVMDGTSDIMSFSFIYPENIVSDLQLKEKAIVTIEDNVHTLSLLNTINNYYDFTNKLILINGERYKINDNLNEVQSSLILTFETDEVVGMIKRYDKTTYEFEFEINNVKYYSNNDTGNLQHIPIYLDKRLYKYMCLSRISSELLSTVANNGYEITVSLSEQTVLLKDCIRTDLAITPSLYPLIPTIDDNGKTIYKEIYPTLLEATYKICDNHNMHLLNEKIISIDDGLELSLSKIACPILTYKDLSTYDQLYDLFIRIGRIPYFENGILYGLILTGDTDNSQVDLYNKYIGSALQSTREDGVNQNVYATKVYNNLYDTETTTVPSYFQGKSNVVEYVAESEPSTNQEILTNWLKKEYTKWLTLNENDTADTKRLLSISNYDADAEGIEDSRKYGLDLPSNIETVNQIYLCKPVVTYTTNNTAKFGFKKVPLGQEVYWKDYKIGEFNAGVMSFSDLQLEIKDNAVYYNNILYENICYVFEFAGEEYIIIGNDIYNDTATVKVATINNGQFTLPDKSFPLYLIKGVGEYRDIYVISMSTSPTFPQLQSVCSAFVYYPSSNPLNNKVILLASNNTSVIPTGNFATISLTSGLNIKEFTLSGIRWRLDGDILGYYTSDTAYTNVGCFNYDGIAVSTQNVEDITNTSLTVNGRPGYQLYKIGDKVYSGTPTKMSDITNNIFTLSNNEKFEWSYLPDSSGNNGSFMQGNKVGIFPTFNWQFYAIGSRAFDTPINVVYEIINNPPILEYSYWSKLSNLQQALFAYYTRGENKINQVISLVAPKNALQGAYQWNSSVLYNYLKSSFYIVEYKPMLNQEYVNYDYNLIADTNVNIPKDICSYNLPFKSITDKQVYPTLEYNLEKGKDYLTDIKIVTNDNSILDLKAGNIIKFKGKNYIIQTISFYINDKTIETTVSLSKNIIQNSSLAQYQDNIRVSTNLSTEDTVTKVFPVLSEEVITLDDSYTENYLENCALDNNYFTQNLGKGLIGGGYFQLGMNSGWTGIDIYDYMREYPLRFSKLINKHSLDNDGYIYYIKLQSEHPYSDTIFVVNKFPIYARRANKVLIGTTNTDYGEVTTINSYQELLQYNSTKAILQVSYDRILGIYKVPYSYSWIEFSNDNLNWVELRPECWEREKYGDRPKDSNGNYYFENAGWSSRWFLRGDKYNSPYTIQSVYIGDSEENDTEQTFCTEGFFTYSGLISSYQFLINNSASLINRFTASVNTRYSTFVENAISNVNVPIEFKYDDGVKSEYQAFTKSTPIFFNTSDEGCRLVGFGATDDNTNNTGIWDTLTSNRYNTILDIREVPDVYLQFKTIIRQNSNNLYLRDLSSDIQWMAQNPPLGSFYVSDYDAKIISFDSSIKLDNLELTNDNISQYDTGLELTKNRNGFIFNKSLPINTSDKKYALIYVGRLSGTIKKVLSFDVLNPVNQMFIRLTVRNSYETISHNKEV